MANKSQVGWACVEDYLSDELASDYKDDREMRAAENHALHTKRFNRGCGKQSDFLELPPTKLSAAFSCW